MRDTVVNGVRMNESECRALLRRVFWKQTSELVTDEQCTEAAEVATEWLIAVGRDGYIPVGTEQAAATTSKEPTD